ncbi:MAG: peptidyl-prolyl cis-trans isomerase, EpsD family [Pseudomonadota bacterium]
MTPAPFPFVIRPSRPVALAGALLVGVLLSACGGGDKKAPTQVAAKVNSGEISVHQVNQVLQRQPGLKPEQVPAASRRILDSLVDQELAIQQAVEQKIDRDPRVVSAIEAARRDIIARAYADKIAEAAPAPTPEEIKAYHDSKPELFAKRRIYAMQEFGIEADATQRAALQGRIGGMRSGDELAAALKGAGVRFAARTVTQAPENLPMGTLEELGRLGDGQWLVKPTPAGLNAVLVVAARPAPVSEEASRKAIEQFLLTERKRKLVADRMRALRDSAKIEYVGSFAQAASAAAGPVSPAPEAPAPLQPGASASDGLDAATLQKGLGIK